MSTAPQLRKMDAKINRLPNWFTIIIKKIQGTQGDTLKHFFSLFSQLVFGTKGVLLEDKNARMSFITFCNQKLLQPLCSEFMSLWAGFNKKNMNMVCIITICMFYAFF
jgi:hypothetical protein